MVDEREDERVDSGHRHLAAALRKGQKNTGRQNKEQQRRVESHVDVHCYTWSLYFNLSVAFDQMIAQIREWTAQSLHSE